MTERGDERRPVTASESIVTFEGVTKTYDGLNLVVKRLDLAIGQGEFLTLLGPSGSGKTTTLMMLAGFETPTGGKITLAGQEISRRPPHKRDIGMVFQNYALFPHMTVAENVAFPLTVRRVPKAQIAEKVQAALDKVRLGPLGARRPAQLSGGQQQRVALARALVFEPRIVLMDEPLGALDKQLREHMQIEIKHLHETLGLTVVYVTHDQSEALTMSDRIAVFHDGVIQQIDAPEALYETPANAFVANFIGENNLLDGVVEHVWDSRCQVRLSTDELIMAERVGRLSPGDRTQVSVRPERAQLVDPESPLAPEENRLSAKVMETIYLGDHSRLIVDVAGNAEFSVKRLAAAVDRPSAGALRQVGFDFSHARALEPLA